MISRWRRIGSGRPWARDTVAIFCIGVLIGVMLAVFWHHRHDYRSVYNVLNLEYFSVKLVRPSRLDRQTVSYSDVEYDFKYDKWLENEHGGKQETQNPDEYRYGVNGSRVLYSNASGYIDGSEAHFLYERLPVVCVLFSPESSESITTVINTWGKRCNDLRFYVSASGRARKSGREPKITFNVTNSLNNPELIRKVQVVEVREAKSDFGLICRAFHQIWKHYRSKVKADGTRPWILVAATDSFVLTENLRFYVAPLNQTVPHYLGHAMKFWGSVYNWAEAGYALSWQALETLIERKFKSKALCDSGGKFWRNGDWYLGKHLSSLGILPTDTRDHAGRGRFNGYSLTRLLITGGVSSFERYWRDSYFPTPPGGAQCCSNFAITFAGVPPNSKMYRQDYLHYHIRPFFAGGSVGNGPVFRNFTGKNPTLTLSEHMKEEAFNHMFDPMLTTPKSWPKHESSSLQGK